MNKDQAVSRNQSARCKIIFLILTIALGFFTFVTMAINDIVTKKQKKKENKINPFKQFEKEGSVYRHAKFINNRYGKK